MDEVIMNRAWLLYEGGGMYIVTEGFMKICEKV